MRMQVWYMTGFMFGYVFQLHDVIKTHTRTEQSFSYRGCRAKSRFANMISESHKNGAFWLFLDTLTTFFVDNKLLRSSRPTYVRY